MTVICGLMLPHRMCHPSGSWAFHLFLPLSYFSGVCGLQTPEGWRNRELCAFLTACRSVIRCHRVLLDQLFALLKVPLAEEAFSNREIERD